MSIATWNVRDFHDPNRKLELWRLINKFRISCFSILENKLTFPEIISFESTLDPRCKVLSNVSCYYKCRILVLLDSLMWYLNLISMSDQHITMELINVVGFKCNASFIYAHNFQELRKRPWSHVRDDAVYIFKP